MYFENGLWSILGAAAVLQNISVYTFSKFIQLTLPRRFNSSFELLHEHYLIEVHVIIQFHEQLVRIFQGY